MLKGAHVAPNFNATLVNQLGLDMWVGTDAVLEMAWTPAQQGQLETLNGEYYHRAVNWLHPSTIATLKDWGVTRWILTNEYDLHYSVPDAVAIITALVQNILAAYPNPNIPQLYLNMGSDVTDLTYHTAVWDALAPSIKNEIDGFTAHRYAEDRTGAAFKQAVKTGSTWMNQRGLGGLKYFVGEFGFNASDTVDFQTLLTDIWDTMQGTAWCDGLLYYMSHYDTLSYEPLINNAGTKLTRAGRAWRDVN